MAVSSAFVGSAAESDCGFAQEASYGVAIGGLRTIDKAQQTFKVFCALPERSTTCIHSN